MISCFIFSIIGVIISAVMTLMFWQMRYVPSLIVGTYAAFILIAQIYYLMHRGFRPVGGTLAFTTFVLAVFLLRYSIGMFDPFHTLLVPVAGAITVMMFGKLFLG